MSEWGDYIDLIDKGHFEILADGTGELVFGAIDASLDGETVKYRRRVEYTWQGDCEGDGISGRGVGDPER